MKFNCSSQTSEFAVSGAVLLYESRSDNRKHVTFHSVDAGSKTGLRIKAGRPMTEQDYATLVKGLAPAQRPEIEWIDDTVLAHGMGKTVWWTPPGHRAMFFKAHKADGSPFVNQAVCPVPGLVWIADAKNVAVFATKVAGRPTKETQLFQAPFFNVWDKGIVCRGTALLPDLRSGEIAKQWEKSFFGSNFTHPNINTKDGLIKGMSPITFWEKMVEAPEQTFPLNRLVDLKITVQNILSQGPF